MKGVPIKFRAKDIYGNVYFGYLNFFGITWSISSVTADGIKTKTSGYNSMGIEPDSVALLVGYDADGKEVYEDDKLILGSHEYIAGIRPVSYTDDKKYYMPEKDFSDFLLKEV